VVLEVTDLRTRANLLNLIDPSILKQALANGTHAQQPTKEPSLGAIFTLTTLGIRKSHSH
jgi:hypothetical protein